MRKIFILLLPILVVTILITVGCNKRTEVPDNSIAWYTTHLLKDSSFANLYYKTGLQIIQAKRKGLHNRFRQLQPVSLRIQQDEHIAGSGNPVSLQKVTTSNSADIEEVYDYTATALANSAYFYLSNPGFFELSQQTQQAILNNISTQLSDPRYAEANNGSLLVGYHHQLLAESQNGAGGGRSSLHGHNTERGTDDISWSIVGACVTGAIGAIVYDYGGLLKTIIGAFSGTERIMWGMVYQVSKTVLKSVVPWYKVIGLAIGLGTCLWSAL